MRCLLWNTWTTENELNPINDWKAIKERSIYIDPTSYVYYDVIIFLFELFAISLDDILIDYNDYFYQSFHSSISSTEMQQRLITISYEITWKDIIIFFFFCFFPLSIYLHYLPKDKFNNSFQYEFYFLHDSYLRTKKAKIYLNILTGVLLTSQLCNKFQFNDTWTYLIRNLQE